MIGLCCVVFNDNFQYSHEYKNTKVIDFIVSELDTKLNFNNIYKKKLKKKWKTLKKYKVNFFST